MAFYSVGKLYFLTSYVHDAWMHLFTSVCVCVCVRARAHIDLSFQDCSPILENFLLCYIFIECKCYNSIA
jgi:hypothetical protein